MPVDILYFARVRERIGVPGETVVTATKPLVDVLCNRDERHADAFAGISSLRVVLDRQPGDFSSLLADVRETAFFPPMIGGRWIGDCRPVDVPNRVL